MVEPTIRSCLKKILVSSAFLGASPDVAPEMTIVPPGRREFTECDHVAAPTVSMTAATPPPAPCTSTVPPGRTPEFVKSIRYAVSHAVGRHAAVSHDIDSGFGTTF